MEATASPARTPPQPTLLILWARGFDEVAAVLLLVELRRAGVRVKLVGVAHHTPVGRHGLALVTDLTLSQALQQAAGVQGLIVPAPWDVVVAFAYDPRLNQLVDLIHQAQGLFIAAAAPSSPTASPTVLAYPAPDRLPRFVQRLVHEHWR